MAVIDLGNIDEFISDADITFTIGGKEFAYTISAEDMIKFNLAEEKTPLEERGTLYVIERGASLVGSSFNRKTLAFKGGLLEQVTEHAPNLSHNALSRIVTSIYTKARWGDDIAQKYADTGDLGKALGLDSLAEKLEEATKSVGSNDEAPSQEMQKEPGETAGDDSVTS